MKASRILSVGVLACALAGCGKGGAGNAGASGGGAAAAADPVAWASDTCKTFPAEAASKASGLKIVKTTPGLSSNADGNASSSCSYQGDGHDNFTVMLRAVSDDSQTAAIQIADMPQHADDLGPAIAVPSSVGQARWLPKMHEIVLFPDDHRTIYVVSPGFRMFGQSASDADQQKQAMTVATAIAAG